LPGREVLPYWAAQVAGALAAAVTARWVVGHGPAAVFTVSGHRQAAALVAELLVTFALAYVVLNVATSNDHPNNSFYGLAIGFTVLAGAVAVGGVSGGVFNPAVAFGVSAAGLVSWSMLWVYLVANLAGGAAAALAFRAVSPDDLGAEAEADADSAAEAQAGVSWRRAALQAPTLTTPDDAEAARQPVSGDRAGS
jgi:aquaporin Z